MSSVLDTLFLRLAELGLEIKENIPLSKYTTIAVGGPARLMVLVKNSRDLKSAISHAYHLDVPFLVIGKGSNLIISDQGFQGLVIINKSTDWDILNYKNSETDINTTPARYEKTQGDTIKIDEYLRKIKAVEKVRLRIDSGWNVAALSKQLYKHGIVGLEWFAGIPATVGGGIFMNMHGGPLFLGDLINQVTIFDGRNERILKNNQLHFDYDYSILHKSRETVLHADFNLWKGDVSLASEFGREWAMEKSFQPRRSAGCIFQNIDPQQQNRLNLPTSSVGYVIDQILGLKGKRQRNAIISEKHAAFIENTGQANAQDIYDLANLIRREARKKLDLDLKLEVQFIGKFKQDS